MSKRTNLYIGTAGQLAAMAEFLSRGWNVAMPEVDVGDDIFVVRDLEGDFWRVQVKTANAVENRRGYVRRLTAVGLVALCMPEVPVEKRENSELD